MANPLSERLGRLFRLQDLDTMIREAQDPELRRNEEEMGFKHDALEKLQNARERLTKKIDPRDLRLYERIVKRLHHGIVPVEDRTCLGCYMALPTSAVPLKTDPDQLLTCENCGRILYWLE
jgi:predicted  nucleic acid-binding Zn-ribbon protein